MKSRYSVFRNEEGRTIVVDLHRQRLARLRRRVFAWARVVSPIAEQRGVRKAMITLTYDQAGTLVDARGFRVGDVEQFTRRLRDRMGARLLACAWALEMHETAGPHYHVFIVFRGRLWCRPDEGGTYEGRRYIRLWPHGMTRVNFKARTPYYLAKYAGKEHQKDFAKFPARAHGWHVWISDAGAAEVLRLLTMKPVRDASADPGGRWRWLGNAETATAGLEMARDPPWFDELRARGVSWRDVYPRWEATCG